jgi:hypothetical protein
MAPAPPPVALATHLVEHRKSLGPALFIIRLLEPWLVFWFNSRLMTRTRMYASNRSIDKLVHWR